ncbi:DUF1577 domain-containing protein [Leptospira venezuelensis]|uniref:DUF1577 domain-containing protein n=1 Tax=Leptospira venezuelensis TaxID=1958811 RepID=UPI001F48F08A|nr:DUF1577 domain-containing protein [Leptospira venezuelensis]
MLEKTIGSQETDQRFCDILSDPSTIARIADSFLYMEELTVKGWSSDTKVMITKTFGDSGQISVRFQKGSPISLGEKIVLQRTLKHHIELNCRTVRRLNDFEFLMQAESISIAKTNRKEERLRVKNDSVFATNIVYHPERFELNRHISLNVIREALEIFKEELKHPKFGEIKIGLFQSGQESKFEIVRKTKKIFYIQNTSKPSSYTEVLPQFVQYSTYFGKNILSAIRSYKNESIISELILPILYDKNDKDSYPKAYLWVRSAQEPILAEDLSELYTLSERIINSIQNSDSIKATDRFDVLNISESGAKIRIHQKELLYNLYGKESLKFDLVFKGRPPIHMNAKICWRSVDRSGKLFLGLQFIYNQEQLASLRKLEYNLQSLRNRMNSGRGDVSVFKIYRSLRPKKRKF